MTEKNLYSTLLETTPRTILIPKEEEAFFRDLLMHKDSIVYSKKFSFSEDTSNRERFLAENSGPARLLPQYFDHTIATVDVIFHEKTKSPQNPEVTFYVRDLNTNEILLQTHGGVTYLWDSPKYDVKATGVVNFDVLDHRKNGELLHGCSYVWDLLFESEADPTEEEYYDSRTPEAREYWDHFEDSTADDYNPSLNHELYNQETNRFYDSPLAGALDDVPGFRRITQEELDKELCKK